MPQEGFSYRSDVRLRKENQDAFGVFEYGLFTLLVVCDGMGGHVGGKQASAIAVRTIHDELERYESGDIRAALRRAIEAANAAIYDAAHRNYRLMGMGTTVVAALVHRSTMHVAHVGDSRCFLLSDGKLRQVTRDHTMVNLFVDAELLSPEDAATHPEAHVLSRSLGVDRQVEVELADPIALAPSDRVLLCSDGVHGVIGNSGLASIEWSSVRNGVQAALAAVNEADGDDNATLVAFGLAVEGGGDPATAPPDPDALEDEARNAVAEEGVAVRRGPSVPIPNHDPHTSGSVAAASSGGFGAIAMGDAGTSPGDDTNPPTPLPDLRSNAQAGRRASGGLPGGRLVFAGALVVGFFGVLGVTLLALKFAVGNKGAEPPPSVAADVAPAPPDPVSTPANTAPASGFVPQIGTPPSEIIVGFPLADPSHDCLSCTFSYALPTAAAYVSASDDSTYAPAFFAPQLEPAPYRDRPAGTVYNRRPPAGPLLALTMQAVKGGRCREALDTVQMAVSKSIDYAQLYTNAWHCFNDGDQAALRNAHAASYDAFSALLTHFEGIRDTIQPGPYALSTFLAPPTDAGAAATPVTDANGVVDLTAGSTTAHAEDPTSWQNPATAGIEYRLSAYLVDSGKHGMNQIVDALIGSDAALDDLGADIALEAIAAAAIAGMKNPTPSVVDTWARRVYVTRVAMSSPLGTALRKKRPDLAKRIQTLLTSAVPEDAPYAVQAASAAGALVPAPFPLAGARIATLTTSLTDVTAPDGAQQGAKPTSPDRRSGGASSPSRGDRTRTRRDTAESSSIRARVQASQGKSVYLKVWYPKQEEPVLIGKLEETVDAP